MTLFMLPALIGVMIKSYLLYAIRDKSWIDMSLIGFVAVFVLQNTSELLLFNSFLADGNADFLMRLYYVCTVLVLAYGFFYLMDEEKFPSQRYISYLLILMTVLLLFAIFFTDQVVAGAVNLSYTVTAIKGDSYWMFQGFAFSCLTAWLICLIKNYRNATSPRGEIKHLYALVGLAPLAIVSISVVALMQMGIHINGTVVVPLASTLFILSVMRGIYYNHGQLDLRATIPFSLELKLSNKMRIAITKYNLDEKSLDDVMDDVEKAFIEYKLLKSNLNISHAAESMRVERSSLYSKLKRLQIDHRQL